MGDAQLFSALRGGLIMMIRRIQFLGGASPHEGGHSRRFILALGRLTRFVFACGALFASACLIAYAQVPAKPQSAAAQGPRRVKVLFLGDNGHHLPLERCRQVFSTLARDGIDLTYTDRLDD